MGLASFSYINREYLDILTSIVEKIPKITPEWTDWNQADIGITMLQQFSAIAEMLAYTQDQHANQLTLPTSTQRSVVINLTKSLAYTMSGYTASSVDLLFERTSPYTTTSNSTTLSSNITAQATYEFTLVDASEYDTNDVMYLTGSNSEYVIVDYKVGNKITIKGVTRYGYAIGDTVSKIDSNKNVTIPDSLKCTTSGSSPINFETNVNNVSYIIYGGHSYTDQTVTLAYSSLNKTITVSNVFGYVAGDSLYISSSLFNNTTTLTISSISGRVITVLESLPSWIQVGDIVCRLVPGIQGQTKNETLTASTGLPSQERELAYTPVINETITVTVNEGSGDETWTEVSSFFSSDSNDKHYTITTQANNKVLISFGDGVNGKIPVVSSVIKASYLQGGGTSGNIGRNTIDKIATSVTDNGGTTVSLTVNNPNAASGGSDKESLEIAKVRAPALYASVYRAVSGEDFESLSAGYRDEVYGTISNAKAIESNVDNAISIYVWSADSNGFATSTSSGLKQSLKSYLEGKAIEGFLISIIDGFTKKIDITGTIYVSTGFTQSVVKNSVLSAIDALFQTDVLTPGEDFYLSNLYESIESVDGVSRSDISFPTRPGVSISDLYMAVKGTVSLTMSGGN